MTAREDIDETRAEALTTVQRHAFQSGCARITRQEDWTASGVRLEHVEMTEERRGVLDAIRAARPWQYERLDVKW